MAATPSPGSGPAFLAPPPPPMTPISSQARNTFKSSFERFEQTVNTYSTTDHRDFTSTTLEDVRQAARQVEQELAARQCLRNMRRLEPLLNGLEAYSKVVEIVCNGTPYVSWIWAPIKLMLKLSADYLGAFEKLIAAYGRIAENLPRFDRLSDAFKDSPDFQQVLAIVYSDILEFHRKAYKFFKRNGWKCFFKSAWGRFDARFNCILDSLSRHSDLVDREANALAIAQTIKWREDALQSAAIRTKDRSAIQLAATLSWLNLDNTAHCAQNDQDDILDKLTSDCCANTTEWLLKHQKMKAWLKSGRSTPILWLKGKPGCGKSTLCAKVIQFLRADKQSTLLYCFYNYRLGGAPHHPSGIIFATLISQILRQNRNLSAYVYEDFVAEGRSPSVQTLKEILSNLIPQTKSPRIVVDGIDECIRYDTSGNPKDLSVIKDVLQDILQLESPKASLALKLLISSRDILQVFDKLSRKPTVALENELDHIRSAIRVFAHHRLADVRTRFDGFSDVDETFISLEDKIVAKSQEMFLWAQLVLLQIEEDAFALNDLKAAIVDMPTTLNDFYARILSRTHPLNASSRERVDTILKWMICSRRPMRAVELQDALVFSKTHTLLDDNSRLPATVIDLCKPLIQVLNDNTVVFVHFTVQEFIIKSGFISLADAEHCVTKCCLNYADFSFRLLDPLVTDEQRTISVGKCLHSMQSYSHEHWMDHLLAGLSTSNNPHPHLVSQLDRLALHMKHFTQSPGTATANLDQEELNSILKLEARLVCFKNYGRILDCLRKIIQHRHLIKLNFGGGTTSEDHETASHTFPLDAIHDEYQKKVLVLLSSDEIPGLDAAQLSKFKALYSPYAFLCRFPDCSSSVSGFPTDDARGQHEASHAPPLLCTHAGCTYTLPFRSLHGLRRHVREYHTVKAIRIPKSVRVSSGLSKSITKFRNGSHRSVVHSTTHQTGSTPDRDSGTLGVTDPLDSAPTTGGNASINLRDIEYEHSPRPGNNPHFDLYERNSVTNDVPYTYSRSPPQAPKVAPERENAALTQFCCKCQSGPWPNDIYFHCINCSHPFCGNCSNIVASSLISSSGTKNMVYDFDMVDYTPDKYGDVYETASPLQPGFELRAPNYFNPQAMSPIAPLTGNKPTVEPRKSNLLSLLNDPEAMFPMAPLTENKPTVEPRKSNLLSLLNDTKPEEPRRRNLTEQRPLLSTATQQEPRERRIACYTCACAKVQCDKARPTCHRCQSMAITCIPRSTSESHTLAQLSAQPTREAAGRFGSSLNSRDAQYLLSSQPNIIAATDGLKFPPSVLDAPTRHSLPQQIETWSHLKNWAMQNPGLLPGIDEHELLLLQVQHYMQLNPIQRSQLQLDQNQQQQQVRTLRPPTPRPPFPPHAEKLVDSDPGTLQSMPEQAASSLVSNEKGSYSHDYEGPGASGTHSASWSTQDDEMLISARAQGLNWNQIAPKYFPAKSPNACRKRHARLIAQNAEQWVRGGDMKNYAYVKTPSVAKN